MATRDKGAARKAKVDRRKKREKERKARAVRTGAKRQAEEAAEEEAELRELEPLGPLFALEGPLRALRFDLSPLPATPPGADTAGAIAKWYFDGLPTLANEEWRARAEETLATMRRGLAALDDGAPTVSGASYDADHHALSGAIHWLDPALATGVGAYHNTLFRFIFDRSAEAAFLDGSLPAWVRDALAIEGVDVRESILERRRDRLSQRITLGAFHDDLAADDMPSAAPMISGPPPDPGRFAQEASMACEVDMTRERRAAVATRLRESARHEREEGRPLTAFDLETLAQALSSDDPVDQGLVRLYYARSVYRRRESATSSTTEWPTA